MLKLPRVKKVDNVDAVISNFLGRPFKWVVIIVTTIMVILPLYWLFTSSVKFEHEYLASPPVLVPSQLTLANFEKIIAQDGVLAGFYNSMVIASMTTLVSVFFGSLAPSAIQGQHSRQS